MAILDLTGFNAALKQLYPNGLKELWYPRSPFLAWVPKKTDFVGEAAAVVPIIAGNRGSTSFSDAIGLNKGTPTLKKFLVTRKKDYSVASVDAETLMASANDRGAIARALDTSIKASMYEMARSMAFQSFNNGGGARGQVAAINGNDVTLTDKNDIVFFEIGMNCEQSADDGTGGAGIAAGEKDVITAVDRANGVVSFLNVAGNLGTLAVGDFLFRAGDYNNCLAGVQAWLTTPTAALFFGVNRTVDPVRLAGVKYSGGGAPIEDVVMDALAELQINGGEADTLFLNNKRFAELQKNTYSKTWVDVETDVPGIGFKALTFAGPTGQINVIGDPSCPYGKGLLAKRESWQLKSLGEAPHFATDDGNRLLRDASSDSVEFRIRSFHNLICTQPGHNCLITW